MATFTFESAQTPAELASLRSQSEATKAPPQPILEGSTGFAGMVTTREGQPVYSQMGTQSVTLEPQLPPDRVRINGMETTRAAAIAAGLLIAEDTDVQRPFADRPAYSQVGGSDEAQQGATEQKSEAPTSAVDAASSILQRAAETHGAGVVEGTLLAAAETGEVPTSLPEGMNQGEAEAVYAGYHQQAENTLAEVGGSVALLSEMLSDRELAEARMATLTQDHSRLQRLGAQAQERLARLPEKDPQDFASLLSEAGPEVQSAVKQGADGSWRVLLPGLGELSWAVAVRSGFIKF